MCVFRQIKRVNSKARLVVVGGEGLLATAFDVMRLSLKIRKGKKVASCLHQRKKQRKQFQPRKL